MAALPGLGLGTKNGKFHALAALIEATGQQSNNRTSWRPGLTAIMTE